MVKKNLNAFNEIRSIKIVCWNVEEFKKDPASIHSLAIDNWMKNCFDRFKWLARWRWRLLLMHYSRKRKQLFYLFLFVCLFCG